MKKTMAGLAVLMLLSGSALAKGPSYAQSRFNAQIQAQDAGTVSAWLEEHIAKAGGQITNSNSDQQNGNGNCNARIPEENLNAFIKDLGQLGMISSQNRSLSDNTASMLENKRQLELAERMAAAQWTMKSNAGSEAERGICEAEFKAYLRDRINSYRSSIAQYEANQGWAEVSLSFTSPGRANRIPSGRRIVSDPVSEEAVPAPPPPPAGPRRDLYVAVPIVLMLGFASLYVLRLPKKTAP